MPLAVPSRTPDTRRSAPGRRLGHHVVASSRSMTQTRSSISRCPAWKSLWIGTCAPGGEAGRTSPTSDGQPLSGLEQFRAVSTYDGRPLLGARDLLRHARRSAAAAPKTCAVWPASAQHRGPRRGSPRCRLCSFRGVPVHCPIQDQVLLRNEGQQLRHTKPSDRESGHLDSACRCAAQQLSAVGLAEGLGDEQGGTRSVESFDDVAGRRAAVRPPRSAPGSRRR